MVGTIIVGDVEYSIEPENIIVELSRDVLEVGVDKNYSKIQDAVDAAIEGDFFYKRFLNTRR